MFKTTPSVIISWRTFRLIGNLRQGIIKREAFLSVEASELAFDSSELEHFIMDKLKSIQETRAKTVLIKTPKSVLVDMILRRLVKIHESDQWLTRKSLDRDLLSCRSIKNSGKCRRAAKELIEILDRDSVTVEVIDDAWDQFMIWKIMYV